MSKMELPTRDGVEDALSWQQVQAIREKRFFRSLARQCQREIKLRRQIHRWNALRVLWRLLGLAPRARKVVELLILRGSPYFDAG